MIIDFGSEKFQVSFGYDSDLVAAVKRLRGRRWDRDEKNWEVSIRDQKDLSALQEFADEHGFKLTSKAEKEIAQLEETLTDEFNTRELSVEKDTVIIQFEYDQGLVVAIKGLEKARWDGKQWKFKPANLEALDKFIAIAREYNFLITEEDKDLLDSQIRKKLIEQEQRREINLEKSTAASGTIEVLDLGGKLMPFQKAGVEYALENRRVFIADDMGLGKTVEALATIQAAGAYPALIVCPASVKLNWQREAEKWLPGKSVSVVKTGKKSNDFSAEVVVINYDILKKHKDTLVAGDFKAVVFDESHYLKNYQSARTKTAQEITKKIDMRLCLTGTPVLNRPKELLSQLKLLGRINDFGGFWKFAKRYCAASETRFGWDMSGASNLEELNRLLRKNCFVRRNKSEVLKELPPKQKAFVPLEITNRREYQKAEKEAAVWVAEQAVKDKDFQESLEGLSTEARKEAISKRWNAAEFRAEQAEHLVRINALKRIAARGKLKAVKEWIASFLETEEKLVVFAHHTEIIQDIADEFDAPTITGSDSAEARQEAVDAFQNDPDCRLIVLNLQAGGVGLTLTAASNVAFLELGWTPATHMQAEDRTHRIGQEKHVTAWYLLAENTIDEEIAALLDEKRKVVDGATDGIVTEASESILAGLVKTLQAKIKPKKTRKRKTA